MYVSKAFTLRIKALEYILDAVAINIYSNYTYL